MIPVQFFQTRMGMRFFESDLPRLISAVERIAVALEKLATPPESSAPKTEIKFYSEAPTVCPNCGQWQRPSTWDCVNECRTRGFAPPKENET